MWLPMTRVALVFVSLAFGVVGVSANAQKPQPGQDGVYVGWHGVKTATLIHAVPALVPDDPKLNGLTHVCAFLVDVGADGALKGLSLANKVASPFDESA